MSFKSSFCLLFFLIAVDLQLMTLASSTTTTNSVDIKRKFEKDQIVEDVIGQAPASAILIHYRTNVSVNFGSELTPSQVKDIPSQLDWPIESNRTLYTLLMTDPDAPSRQTPTKREFLHWLVVNIPGTDISSGDTFAQYIGSGAPQNTGLHRYVFLVYKQTGRLVLSRSKISNRSAEGRPKFSVRNFVKQHSLGPLVAGNYFQAQYDSYVPILHSQLRTSGETNSLKQSKQ